MWWWWWQRSLVLGTWRGFESATNEDVLRLTGSADGGGGGLVSACNRSTSVCECVRGRASTGRAGEERTCTCLALCFQRIGLLASVAPDAHAAIRAVSTSRAHLASVSIRIRLLTWAAPLLDCPIAWIVLRLIAARANTCLAPCLQGIGLLASVAPEAH